MDQRAEEFETERPRLRAIAARILGSTAEADDVVQEAWLRLARTSDVDNVAAWLTTVVSRLCLDQLRSRKHVEPYDDPAAVSPGTPASAGEPVDPEAEAVLADQVGAALVIVLETLSPAERVAFVLHDLFGVPFDDVAGVLGRSPAAVRQLASRGRRAVAGGGVDERAEAERRSHRQVVDAFLDAARGGDLNRLLELLAPDAIMTADPAGISLGTEPIYAGADAVAARFNGVRGAQPVTVDGWTAAAWVHHREVKVAFLFTVADGRITCVDLVADPEMLRRMEVEIAGNPARGA
ncbi:RNA polymerase sigma-70 factor, ECF subfamily [Nocardioides terrae]|uniref:RNA polymerase sigma-70 factor, ECF subfamily n=1 Tax=Nocardioides terrae TaxID=574651 RepID=A0A1I1NA38_9ACTN|nr:sigma-70 family RNA polymerase sigma factor [Nocardioides terrae]SFC92338.1 RNA polymerase sigma-70 factor, ECF subfamily [Nocardioides terrae]